MWYFNSILLIFYTHLYTFRVCQFSFKEFLRSGYREYCKNFILCGGQVIIGYANTMQYPQNFLGFLRNFKEPSKVNFNVLNQCFNIVMCFGAHCLDKLYNWMFWINYTMFWMLPKATNHIKLQWTCLGQSTGYFDTNLHKIFLKGSLTGLLLTPQEARMLINKSRTQIVLQVLLSWIMILAVIIYIKKSQIHQHNRDVHQYMEIKPYITEQWRLTLTNI